MKIEVQFFSRLRDLVGATRLEREIAPGETVGSVLAALYEQFPRLREWDAHLLLAVGVEFVERGQTLKEGDTLSIMPPVQGG